MKPVPPTSPWADSTRIITTLGRTRCATPATESGGRACASEPLAPVPPPRLIDSLSSPSAATTPMPAPSAPATSAMITATTARRPRPGPPREDDGGGGTGAQFGPPGGEPNPATARGPPGGGPMGAGGGPTGAGGGPCG